ncbi:insulinase family protein [Ruminococcus bromii]|nr:insulinase family protein [Ruminococcus bromii]RGI76372.1 insulinase family protein [Ruminococcus bromii]RGI80564.1 insulinase family protein [Ruminococcus bromii]
MEKKLVKLKNGITFISQKLDNVHSVTISVNFKVGSLYEDQINNGITHLIEHLFFRQWDNLPQKQLYYEMQCMGAGTNYSRTGKYTGKGIFTITEVKNGQGSDSGWGRLKSGAGWISLDYAVRV